MMILIKNHWSSEIAILTKKFLHGGKVYISGQNTPVFLVWSISIKNVDIEIHEWLSTFIQILSENFRFFEWTYDRLHFVCLPMLWNNSSDFLQLCKFFEIFLENFSSFCGSLTKFFKIFENFTAEIGFWPQESQFLFLPT